MPTISDPWLFFNNPSLFFNNPSLFWGGIVLLVFLACLLGPSRLS